jgi:hypothetical protein
MKKFFLTVMLLAMLSAVVLALSGCTEADRVSHNVSVEADNFNVTRRITVINTRSDAPLLEIIGNFSIQNTSGDVDIIVEVGPHQYKKHFVHLNSWTTYVVEDVSGAYVDKYHYEVNILPQMIVPVTFTSTD